ncbi:hypothetical protein MCOR02_009277 [Pyricularia oryzae]|nr:hypothetical protein MCOR02_009277 [Pyricularia oryzae]KAI6306346.1 hypothetical protein MCOR34_008082 [Pyricularia oryzae]KAI6478521.1 hypothetical protein MCOR17_000107 [Pyricularia oryzae]KAI6498329.1 hypothetical protein MCOR13_006533 [Pyricularia oryzae]KAI6604538.1 hypothetical protein MCOR04_001423 [Pyricularia oryzae]
MPSLKTVILGFMAASITLAGPIPIVRPGSVDTQRTVRARDGNTADPISGSLEVPVMDEQDQVITASSELDDKHGGLEARQSRTSQQRKAGTRPSSGGKGRGGRGGATTSTGLNVPKGTRLNPGILQAVAPPALPVSSGRKISGVLLDRDAGDRKSRAAEKAKGGTRKTTGEKPRGGRTDGGSRTTIPFNPKPERISPDILAQISRPPPLEVTSTRRIPDSLLGPSLPK